MPVLTLLLKGFLLGWSVAWPPGPINAEMIRRGLSGGMMTAWLVGLGACTADFFWALAMALGAGALLQVPGVRLLLGVVSTSLLLVLAGIYARAAWKAWWLHRDHAAGLAAPAPSRPARLDSARGSYLLGLGMALSSPWNVAFWLAVMGAQSAGAAAPGLGGSVVLACAVIAGAASWGLVLCTSLHFGARFATPSWQILTSAATAALMLYFALLAIFRLAGGA